MVFWKAFCKAALNLCSGGLIGNALEMAEELMEEWGKTRNAAQRRQELEGVAAMSAQAVRDEVRQYLNELKPKEAADIDLELIVDYATAVPARIRQISRRPSDPQGKSISKVTRLDRAEDLAVLMPPGRPRFRAGDEPFANSDWRLEELLGVGGFGEVWRGRNPITGQVGAFKFCTDKTAQKRLLEHEANVCARVMVRGPHPGVVALQDTHLRAETPCLRFEFVDGYELGLWLADRPALTAHEVTAVIRDLAETVAFMHKAVPHSQPVVHRDLKPANILVQGDRFRITDFGIGGLSEVEIQRDRTSPQRTKRSKFLTESLRGAYTEIYASPEQMRGDDPHPRDDVHALGVIWYQMAMGDFSLHRPSGKWQAKLQAKGMTPELIDILADCLEDGDDRLADAGVLFERLKAVSSVNANALVPVAVSASGPVSLSVPVSGSAFALSLGISMVPIPIGEFAMGSTQADVDAAKTRFPKIPLEWFTSEMPQHTVKITKLAAMSAHPITLGQFKAFVLDAGYATEAEKDGIGGYGWVEGIGSRQDPQFTWRNVGFAQTDQHPVVNVSWNDAQAFTEWLSRKDGREYRLPTEAEWEYCCRAGSRTMYSFGDDPDDLARYGNILDVSGARKISNSFGDPIKTDDGYVFTSPVGTYLPNRFGLYDMHGNVWDWCLDGYDAAYYARSPTTDPVFSPEGADLRVFRGGSWHDSAGSARSARRGNFAPMLRDRDLGFRIAQVRS